MNHATLQQFRDIAESMSCGKDKTWAVCRRYVDGSGINRFSIVAFGYTQEAAERAARYYKGGCAMPEAEAMNGYANRERQPITPQIK